MESQIEFPAKATPRSIVVVGGGPGGMETARLLDEAGHHVILFEASGQLGGTARIAAIAYEPNGRLVDWLTRQIAQSGVDVRLNTRADSATIEALKPDLVVVATGAARHRPSIRGADAEHVFDGNDLRRLLTGDSGGADDAKRFSLVTRALMGAGRMLGLVHSARIARQASRLWMPLGKRIVIVGGDLVGLELAEFLAHRGRVVTVVDDAAKLGAGLPPLRRGAMLDDLESAGVILLPSARDIAINVNDVHCTDAHGAAKRIAADNVILAKGATADLSLAAALQESGVETRVVGDCRGVGYIAQAMRDAAEVAAAVA